MIKNQLYPYVEKYINEYLYGFSKEQLEVGVMNGIILLEKLNIRPDKANEKLDKQDSPIWLKAGLIRKIQVGCSLMNFIGEKPLEVEIDSIEILLCPSFKWIIQNQFSFLEEDEESIKLEYDAKDNNSKDIFSKRVHIFDGSFFKKKAKLLEFLKDKSKVSEIIHKVFTKAMKFYYQTNYFVNLKIKNVHIRFEDDTFNYFGGTIFGIRIESLELNLSAEGKLKKDNFKITNLNIYHEDVKSSDNFIISSNLFLSKLNEGVIEEDYYKIIEEVYDNAKDKKPNETVASLFNKKLGSPGKQGLGPSFLSGKTKVDKVNVLENFNCMGRIGIINDAKTDLFTAKSDKTLKFNLNLFTNDIKLNINPTIIGKISSFQEFLKGYFLNDPIQNNKPMRKPYNAKSELVFKYKDNELIKNKRKLLVRDWWFYFIWFSRFKTAIYGKPFTNKLQEEFAKYFNICCASQSDIYTQEYDVNIGSDNKDFNKEKLNDSIELKKSRTKTKEETKESIGTVEDLNPDKIQLHLNLEFNVKSVAVTLLEESPSDHLKHKLDENEDIIKQMIKNKDNKDSKKQSNIEKEILSSRPNSIALRLEGLDCKIFSNCKDQVESTIGIKNIMFLNSIEGEIQKLEVNHAMENALGLEEKEKKTLLKQKSIIGNSLNGKIYILTNIKSICLLCLRSQLWTKK